MIRQSTSRLQQIIRAILIIYYWFVTTAALITLSEKLYWNSQIISIVAMIILVASIISFIFNIFWYKKQSKITYGMKSNDELHIIIKNNIWVIIVTIGLLLGSYWLMKQNYKFEYFAKLVSLAFVPPLAHSFLKMVNAKIVINSREEN